jgi:predicted small secreted protein
MRGKSFRLSAVILLVAVLLAGCAGTARGVKQSVYQHDASLAVEDNSRSQADAMVVIRYPAVVDEAALPAFYRGFTQHPIGGNFKNGDLPPAESERIAQSIITKSNFYVMSLYRELSQGLPENSVLLSPHMITLDADNRLTSQPLLASEQVPTVITIDFSVYSFPDPRKMMDSPPLTLGDIVTPMVVIHADRWIRPSTHGLLLSSEPLVEAGWVHALERAEGQARRLLPSAVEPGQRPLDFITFLDRGDQQAGSLPTKSPGESRREVVSVEVHPLEKIRMDANLMRNLEHNPDIDPFAEEFVKGAATRVVRALNRADHDRATFFERQAALSRFDPELGVAFLSRSGSEDLRARLQMGEALIKAEKAFLATQSQRLYEGTYEGVFGMQARQMIGAEFRMLEQRRNLARQQNWSTAIAIVAMAGAVYAGSDADSSNFFHSSTAGNLAMLTSMWAVNSAIAKNVQSKTVSQNFLMQMAPAINRQVSVQLEWLDSTEKITAQDFDEFREKTLALYQRSVRALESHHQPGCEFHHPAFGQAGVWIGRCSNDGLAEQGGYGVVLDDAGNTVEYVGETRAGLAEGAGAMIFRSPQEQGAIYYEGNFRAGQPDGVVLVEEPARKPAVRKFEGGVDRGAADEAERQQVEF